MLVKKYADTRSALLAHLETSGTDPKVLGKELEDQAEILKNL